MGQTLTAFCKDADGNLIRIGGGTVSKEHFREELQCSFPHLEIITVLTDEDITFIKEMLNCNEA
jgi:hypothetical protein